MAPIEEMVFHVARDISSPETRCLYLDQVCGGDARLHKRVEALLAVHERDASFLKSEAVPDTTLDPRANNETVGEEIGL